MKPGRNDPCPCGSGKKFKHCCGKDDAQGSVSPEPVAVPPGSNIPRLLQTALQQHEAGQIAQAETLYQQVLKAEPRNFDALHLLGVAAYHRGDNVAALVLIERAIAINPRVPDSYINYGEVFRAMGQLDKAAMYFRKALQLKPGLILAHNNLGVVLHKQGKLVEAIEQYQKTLKLKPDFASAHNNLAIIFCEQSRLGEARASCEKALAINPAYADAYNNLGTILQRNMQPADAEAAFRKCIHYNPDYAEAYKNLGLVLQEQNRLEEARASYEQALLLKAKHAEASIGSGVATNMQGAMDGEKSSSHAPEVDPGHVDVHRNQGMALLEQGRRAEAIASFEKAGLLKEADVGAVWNYALALLAQGDLAFGWEKYEWRWMRKEQPSRRPFPQPLWDGSDLSGKSILVWGEQGVGDELHFSSLLPDLIVSSKRVVIECAPKLFDLFVRSFPQARVVARTDPPHPQTLEGMDYQSPLGSLARWLRPTLESFPAHKGYLIPDAKRVAYWKDRLDERGAGLKIGIGWRSRNVVGTSNHLYDTVLERWGEILKAPGVVWVNLQYDKPHADIESAQKQHGVVVHDFDEEIDLTDNLDETAALTAACDLVISVSTAVSIMAGAVGVPVWQMSFVHDWHRLGTDYMPWYPSMKRFDRAWNESWDEVLRRVADELMKKQSVLNRS